MGPFLQAENERDEMVFFIHYQERERGEGGLISPLPGLKKSLPST